MTRRRSSSISFGKTKTSVTGASEWIDHEARINRYFVYLRGKYQKSTQGGIQNRLEMSSLHLAEEYARKHPMEYLNDSIYPEGEITARPTLPERQSGPPDSDEIDGDLDDYGFVSRRLLRIIERSPKRGPTLCEAIEFYLGRFGDVIEREYGGAKRIWSIYHLTAAGRALLRQEESRPAKPAPRDPATKGMNRTMRRAAKFAAAAAARTAEPDQAIASMVGTEHGRMLMLLTQIGPSDAVLEGAARCEIEAVELLRRACAAWLDADEQLEAAVGGRGAA